MKRLTAVIALLGLCATAACQKDAKPLVDAAAKYEKDSCACKDSDCLKKAADDYRAATEKLQGEKLVPTEEQANAITEHSKKAVECNTKVATQAAAGAAAAAASAMPK